MQIIQKPSPNFGDRKGHQPKLVVIHVMDGTLAGTDSWFAIPASQVSAHYGVGKNGEIHQYVDEKNSAWHAGRVNNPTFKLYQDGVNPNLYTIGIEHEGIDLSKAPLNELQASAELLKSICDRWAIPIDRDHVIGHYQVYSLKPNCPATDKTVIDRIISLATNTQTPVTPKDIYLKRIGEIKQKLVELETLINN